MKKQIPIVACAALICVCLLGCGKQGMGKSDKNPGIKESAVTTTENGGETVAPSTQYISQEISENLHIDAEAVIPGKNQYSAYTLKMVDCDPDRLFNLFCPEGYGSYTMEDRGNCIVYDESAGRRLVVYEKYQNIIQYTTYNFSTEDRPMQDVETLMYYHSLDYPQAVPHDLPFIKVEDMENFGLDILNKLGISWEPKLLRCVTLSGQEIMDFQEELFGNGDDVFFRTPTALTEATDTCYLQFNFAFDGIPLIGFEEPTIYSYEDFAPMEATATIMFNADGIQSCTVSCPCEVEEVSDPQPILNVEEAIKLLKDKYDLQILYAPLKFTDIWMEYVPVKRDEIWVLTPYWCLREIDEDAKESPNYFGSAERFNAITGKDLTYGG